MRIIAGQLGGRQFDSPKKASVHPMSEKARGAIFNALGDIEGLSVLDAFAGSGALGFEAISRGANHAIVVEKDRPASKVIEKNIKQIGLADKVKLIKAGAGSWLNTSEDYFDIVLLDPPYHDIQKNLLKRLATRSKKGGLVILSLPPAANFQLKQPNFELLTSKSYGDATLSFYRHVG